MVLAVTAILMALIFPSYSALRENAQRLGCASNMRNIGMGLAMFSNDHNDTLPRSEYARTGKQQEMMASHRGEGNVTAWEGIGLLYIRGYCRNNQCFHCPSHRNIHDVNEYAPDYLFPTGERQIFTNYHYAGDYNWATHRLNRLIEGDRLVLLTDGLRTVDDYNHRVGMNVLRGDLSVYWHMDAHHTIRDLLPTKPGDDRGFSSMEDLYTRIWSQISFHANPHVNPGPGGGGPSNPNGPNGDNGIPHYERFR